MISAIVLVLFVRDKYTINILVGFDAVSVLLLTSLIAEEEQAEIKRADTKNRCVIEILIYNSNTADGFAAVAQTAGYLFNLTGLSRCEKVSEPIFHLPF